MELQAIESHAVELFVQGGDGHTILLEAWGRIPSDQVLAYPELTYQVAKIFINQGNHPQGRLLLDICLEAWANDAGKQARVYLMLAQLAYNDQDYEGVRLYVSKVQENSQNETHLAECHFLLGEVTKADDLGEAFNHFDAARTYFMRAQLSNPLAAFDVARASQRASGVAFQRNMRRIGWRYQREAEQFARSVGNPDLLSTILIRSGEALENEGRYPEALAAYREAALLVENPTRVIEAHYRMAWIALLMGDDRAASQVLEKTPQTDHARATCEYLLVQAWQLGFSYEADEAKLKLLEMDALRGGDQTMRHLGIILRGFLAAQQGTVTPAIMDDLAQAIAFFEQNQMVIEISQAKLICAWCYALLGDGMMAQQVLDAVQGTIRSLGHANHLFRLYETSLALLGGWWDADVLNLLLHAERQFQVGMDKHVRVYGFGVPRLYVNGIELTTRERYGQVGMKVLLFMLEKRQARFWEIVDAVYPDADPGVVSNRLHSAMSTFKKGLNVPDWCVFDSQRQLYVVKPDFPYYYDVDAFNNRTFA